MASNGGPISIKYIDDGEKSHEWNPDTQNR